MAQARPAGRRVGATERRCAGRRRGRAEDGPIRSSRRRLDGSCALRLSRAARLRAACRLVEFLCQGLRQRDIDASARTFRATFWGFFDGGSNGAIQPLTARMETDQKTNSEGYADIYLYVHDLYVHGNLDGQQVTVEVGTRPARPRWTKLRMRRLCELSTASYKVRWP